MDVKSHYKEYKDELEYYGIVLTEEQLEDYKEVVETLIASGKSCDYKATMSDKYRDK